MGADVRDVAAERADVDAAVAGWTICSAFARMVERDPDAVALEQRRPDGSWQRLSRAEYRDRVRQVTLGLLAEGVQPGDFGIVMGANRVEHVVADLAIGHARGASVSVYNTSAPEQIAYIAAHCGAVVAFLENPEYLSRLRKVRAQLPALRRVVLMEGSGEPDDGDWVLTWDELVARGAALADAEFERSWQAVQPDDLLALIYTSGTTGDPKGVMYSHHVVLWTAESFARMGSRLFEGGSAISYLPLAHVSERYSSHWQNIWAGAARDGWVVYLCPDIALLPAYIAEKHPTWFVGVPRVWEKLAASLQAGIAAQPDEVRGPVQAALAAGRELADYRARREEPPAAVVEAAERAQPVLQGLLARVGLDQVRLATTSTAPIPYELELFWAGLGITLNGVWGMSELTGPATTNPLEDLRPGTVGIAMPGVEVRVAEEDGELLVRGGNVMLGYYRDPERTAETLDADGWLHSGDVARVDDDGYVRIVDRKKELIITSSGKNISPANVEALLKMHPLVGQAMAVGDGHSYLTALLVLDPDVAPAWAAARGLSAGTAGELATEPAVVEALQQGVREANAHLARIEQVKRFTILADEWTPVSGELTATQKMKRRVIADRYAREMEAMYADPPAGHGV